MTILLSKSSIDMMIGYKSWGFSLFLIELNIISV